MSTEIAAVDAEDFKGQALHDGEAIETSLQGTADYAALDALEMMLGRVHAEAKRLGVRNVTVDMRKLEFMNSSCFKTLVSWITDVQELPEAARYKVTFLSNPKLYWQKRSLHSLRSFAVDLVTITEA
ncbi:MAG TPA: hypothetical protein VGM90_32075 [Kofleriaceae bacterium]|jgi:hypothetical protein